MADIAAERGDVSREELLRGSTHLALAELLRGQTLTEEECADVRSQLAHAAIRRVSELLGLPGHMPLPDLRTREGARRQYDFQRVLRRFLGLPAGEDRFEEVLQHLSQSHCQEAIERGAILFLPPRITFMAAVAALERGLERNAHLLPRGRLHVQPVYVNQRFQEEGLRYDPAGFAPDPAGKTEQQWRREADQDVLLIEPSADVPQAARHRSAAQALQERREHEVFLAPQAWMLLFLTLLELRGEALDQDTRSLLPGACFLASPRVPFAHWTDGSGRARIDWDGPDCASEDTGPRVAVRVV